MSEQTFATPSPVRLELKIASGDVNVSTVDGAESIVVLDGPEKLIETMRVELVGDRLVVEERRKGFAMRVGSFGAGFRVRVQVPERSSVDIATASSDVRLDGQFASFSMKSASGDVRATGEIVGNASFSTASGSARLARVRGALNSRTVSGDVNAEVVDGSVSGKSVSGDLEIGVVREGKVDVHSVSGDVVIGIASGTNIDVDAGSVSGDLSSEIPLRDKTPVPATGPAVAIRVQTVNGDVLVRRAV
jgi:DUF4097 and DUF4098 domain-containing protein YvlB